MLPCGADHAFERPSVESGQAALAAIEMASELALARQVDAVVTAPVSKRHIAEGGIPFVGHTEYLAARAAAPQVVMMLVGGGLRVALATTHLALADVPRAITRASTSGASGTFFMWTARIFSRPSISGRGTTT